MNRVLTRLLKPLATLIRLSIGSTRYRALVNKVIRSHRFDEVYIIWRAIGVARTGLGVMLDIGSHRGESAELFAEVGWQVHCFEPNPLNWPIIDARVINKFQKTRLYRVAVGETPESSRTFYTSPESSGISSLHSFHETHRPTFPVEVITLADHCSREGVERVDFLKIDTEGFDYFVLRGIDWDMCRPDVIVCEFEDRKTEALGYGYVDMGNYLVERGYRVIVSEWKPIRRYGGEHEWLRYADFPCVLQDRNGWGNLIAIRDRSAEVAVFSQLDVISPGTLCCGAAVNNILTYG